ncbi:MAG: RNA methyltransferase [Anaerolineaceae bacterium]|nr:RNA methyltransferase [Anaerolineaceae bacterium]
MNKTPLLSYTFRECLNPDCMFRFPAPTNLEKANICPRCHGQTKIVHTIQLLPDHDKDREQDNPYHLEMVLDNIRSTFNVGAMFRTADGAGVKKIHLTGITPPPEHTKVQKTALGAENTIPYHYHPNCVKAVSDLKKQGYYLIALEKTSTSTPLDSIHLQPHQPTAVVVGNEVAGVDPDVLALCDAHIHISMNGLKGSLNVAIAYGIAVYHLLSTQN